MDSRIPELAPLDAKPGPAKRISAAKEAAMVDAAIGAAFEDLRRRYPAQNLAGVVVVSDFVQNAGPPPVEAAGSLGVPVFAAGLGPTAAADLAVELDAEPTVKKAIETLKGRARVKRTMWSRRAQEYEAKINSGDLVSIAEVVRDLYRSESQPEQSYSERQLYEAALDRMAREIAVVEKLDERGAVQRIIEVLAKSARGRGVAAAEAA